MTMPNGAWVVAFDFDGVLHEYHGYNGGVLLGPMPGMKETVERLHAAGAHVVVFTTRPKETVAPWLAKHGFPPLDVINHKWKRVDVWVDDRAIRFEPAMAEDPAAFTAALLAFAPHWRVPGTVPYSSLPDTVP